MKKKQNLIIILSLFYYFSSFVYIISEPRTVKVGVFPAAPMVFIKDGKPDGLFIELIEYFSIKYNWDIQYVEGTWSELQINLEKGEIDLLPALGYTNERALKYTFSKYPVYIDSGVLFIKPKFVLHTIYDLQGKKVAALRDSIFTSGFIDYIKSFGVNCKIVLTDDNHAVMKAITNGNVDAGVCIYSLGNELLKEYPIKITPISFSPIALHFAVSRNKNIDIITDIDDIMSINIGDPKSRYNKIYSKWTLHPQHVKFPSWIWWIFVIILIIIFFLISWNFLLKKQVAAKTQNLKKEISERKQVEKMIKKSLNEKETLLRELYHRTKNTMQVIRDLIKLQAAELPTNKQLQQLVKNTEDRIQAISLVHQMLYKSQDLSQINIKTYIKELSGLIFYSFGISEDRISLNIKISITYFLLDTAVPFGLILNELITNSLKYAFPDNKKGTIFISLKNKRPNKYIFYYSDDGIGVPDQFKFENQNTLGLKLIYNIAELQMMGKVNFKKGNGISCQIEIPKTLYKARV